MWRLAGKPETMRVISDRIFQDVENVKEDMRSVEQLYKRLQESNEESKTVHNAKTMKELRA